jgi:diguanylate cyclase (GGDEF)-like protein
VARILTSCVRDRDIVARLGGDEFIILVKQAGESLIPILEQRFAEELDASAKRRGKPYAVAFSWGFLNAGKLDRLEDTMRKADEHMLVAKRRKKALAATSS